MGFLNLFRQPDINAGVAQFQQTPGAVLLDVRTAEEYRAGHIPGSTNLDLQMLHTASSLIPTLETPLFVYCHSGARSRIAVSQLQSMGYTNATNIGGITAFRGNLRR